MSDFSLQVHVSTKLTHREISERKAAIEHILNKAFQDSGFIVDSMDIAHYGYQWFSECPPGCDG